MNITVTKTTSPKQKPQGDLTFGDIFSDHMFVMDYDPQNGLALRKDCSLRADNA